MTPARLKALQIFKDFGPLTPKQFAKKMWPDSPRWRVPVKCGPNGSHRGGGMYLAAGGFIGKLSRDKLLDPVYESGHVTQWKLSEEGEKALNGPKRPV